MTTIMSTLALSYDQIAARLEIAVPSARRLVHRKKWRKGKGNDGRAVVQVPAEFFEGRQDGPSDNHHDRPSVRQQDRQQDGHDDGPKPVLVTDSGLSDAMSRLAAAQAELVEMARRLGAAEGEAAALRADRDRWAGIAEELARKPRGFWGWLRMAG
jgi:hypothetical protein